MTTKSICVAGVPGNLEVQSYSFNEGGRARQNALFFLLKPFKMCSKHHFLHLGFFFKKLPAVHKILAN